MTTPSELPRFPSDDVLPLREDSPKAIKALEAPFSDDVKAELVAMAFVHEDAGVRKAAMKWVKANLEDAADFKAAYKAMANVEEALVEERLRAFAHPLRDKIALAMFYHRRFAASYVFEHHTPTRRALLELIVEKAKRDGNDELELKVVWASGSETRLYPDTLPETFVAEVEALRELHPFTGLNFWASGLSELPDTFAACKGWLKSLSLGYCNLTTWPDVLSELELLEKLDLSGTQLSDIPKSIGKLDKLRWLDISYGKKMKSLPQSVCSLDGLTFLNIGSGAIRTIPKEVGSMTSLEQLHMMSCKVAKLPASIRTLSNLTLLSRISCPKLDRDEVQALMGDGCVVH